MNWVVTSVIAAFFQNARSSVQKKLNSKMSLMASTYVRFSFSLPIILVLYFLYYQNIESFLSSLHTPKFLIYIFLGSIFQISFTFLFLYLFKFTNFLVGTTLSKTEVIQVALFEYIILSENLNQLAVSGIVLSTLGVIIFTTKDHKKIINNLFSKSTLIGILCGTLLALSIVFFRGSMLELNFLKSDFDKAFNALFFSTLIQTILITLYLVFFEKDQFKKIKNNFQLSCLAGLFGFLATFFWFYSFSIIHAAFVRAVGQVELIFSYLSSRFLFKEKIRIIEIVGIIIFATGISLVLFFK